MSNPLHKRLQKTVNTITEAHRIMIGPKSAEASDRDLEGTGPENTEGDPILSTSISKHPATEFETGRELRGEPSATWRKPNPNVEYNNAADVFFDDPGQLEREDYDGGIGDTPEETEEFLGFNRQEPGPEPPKGITGKVNPPEDDVAKMQAEIIQLRNQLRKFKKA